MQNLHTAYDQLRSGGGLFVHRSDRGLLRLDGEQRIWFLQNVVTSDVEQIAEGHWGESCFLTAKGRVAAHLRIGVMEEAVWVDVDPPATADLVDWFTRYRFRTKVEIEDRSPGAFTVLGPPALELAGPGRVADMGTAVVFGGELGSTPVADVHAETLPPGLSDLPRADPELYEVLRIRAGIPKFGLDYGPDTLAQEAGLTRILSVSKGCYVGQEVVARLHFRGHVNRVVRPLTFARDADPAALAGKALLAGGRTVGQVTSAVRSPADGVIGMGMVRVEVEAGGELELEDGGRAEVGTIPEGTKVSSEPGEAPPGSGR